VLQSPRGITVDSRGFIVVVECKIMRVVIFDPYGNVTNSFYCNGQLQFPNNICTNDKQEVLICDNRLNCVKVFTYDGKLVRQIGCSGLTNFPIGVAVNNSGDVIICDNHKTFNITVFDQDGKMKRSSKSLARHIQCLDIALFPDDARLIVCSKDCKSYVYRYDEIPEEERHPNHKDSSLEWYQGSPPMSEVFATPEANQMGSADLWKPLKEVTLTNKGIFGDFSKEVADDSGIGFTPQRSASINFSTPMSHSFATTPMGHSFATTPIYNFSTATPMNHTFIDTPMNHTYSTAPRDSTNYELCFGAYGIQPGQITEPSGVAITPSGDIVLADTNNHRVQVYDSKGVFKMQFGKQGKNEGQLLYPNRVAVSPVNGSFVITERLPSTHIHIYDDKGLFLRRFGANVLQHPRGVAVDKRGFIAVIECKIMRVVIFDLYGNVAHSFYCNDQLQFPNNICTSGNDEVLICDNRLNCVKVFTYTGKFVRQISCSGMTNFPIGVGVDDSGDVVIVDNHRTFNITVFDKDGAVKKSIKSTARHIQILDMAVFPDCSRLAVCSKDCKIYIYRYDTLVNEPSQSSKNSPLEFYQKTPPSSEYLATPKLGSLDGTGLWKPLLPSLPRSTFVKEISAEDSSI